MGKLIWHDLARLVALTASAYLTWSNCWGIAYRKFFWDFVGGRLGPHGIIPPSTDNFFESIIVRYPILQILNIVNGLVGITIEYPLPWAATWAIRRNFHLLIGLYAWFAVTAILVYQSTDAALYFLVAGGMYVRALVLGERRVLDEHAHKALTV